MNHFKLSVVVLFSTLLLLISCSKEKIQPSNLFEKYKNSVVLIKSNYYYKISLDNGFTFFAIYKNGEPTLMDEEEAIESAQNNFTTGTGFFISNKGEIATNRHVIYPVRHEEEFYKKIIEMKSIFNESIENKKNEKDKIRDYYNTNYSTLGFSEKEKLESDYQSIIEEIQDFEKVMNFSIEETEIEIIRLSLGITFYGAKITSFDDFSECTPKMKSEGEDIAIIQLNDKITPPKVIDYFSIDKLINYNINPKINDNIFIIGFNKGFSLALTENGIKSQFTQGKITQEPQSKEILYSIPILGGSSGSPVIDEYGNIVAINFAMSTGGQSFNFGVPINNLLKLYYGDNIPKINTISSFKRNDVKFAYKFKNYFNNK